MGSATPASVETLARLGARGSQPGNVWRDLRGQVTGTPGEACLQMPPNSPQALIPKPDIMSLLVVECGKVLRE